MVVVAVVDGWLKEDEDDEPCKNARLAFNTGSSIGWDALPSW